jgi:CheY-like chemotaxis protein
MNACQEAASAFKERRSRAPLRILVADDDRDTVDGLAFILRDEGYIVHGVYTGRDVLPAVRILRPDAVILDIAIPGMSGYAVAQAIRNSFTDLRKPLMIALSGMWTDLPDRMVAHQVGFDHHLSKPYQSADVLRLLRPLPGGGPQG